MPTGGSYRKADVTASVLKRQVAKRVSYNQTQIRPRSGDATGKFAGIGASGGTMNTGGKRRPGSRTVR